VLVNCAGIFEPATIADTTEALWDRTMAVNLTAAWTLSHALLDSLRRRRGVIVNVASDAALLGYADCAAYCASKGALVGLTKALAVELAPDVRAIAVCPGPVETDMMREAVAASPDPAAELRTWTEVPMLRRAATASEIAEAIAFAASPRASYMTGDVLVIDGGATAGRRVGV
jgi:NAD(P)-dependent dehydrogenase (short-subunit alcohol dehydrogenase family)